jgi:hypothetical protein
MPRISNASSDGGPSWTLSLPVELWTPESVLPVPASLRPTRSGSTPSSRLHAQFDPQLAKYILVGPESPPYQRSRRQGREAELTGNTLTHKAYSSSRLVTATAWSISTQTAVLWWSSSFLLLIYLSACRGIRPTARGFIAFEQPDTVRENVSISCCALAKPSGGRPRGQVRSLRDYT